MGATGPNVSSREHSISDVAPEMSVGCKKRGFPATALPPNKRKKKEAKKKRQKKKKLTEQHLSSLGCRVGNVCQCLVHGCRVDERALRHARLEPVARHQSGHFGGQFFHKLVVDAFLHKDAIGTDAGLTRVAKLGNKSTVDGSVQIGIVKN